MNKKTKIIIFALILLAVIAINLVVIKLLSNKEEEVVITETESKEFAQKASTKILGIDVTDLDLFFLKNNNEGKNMIYSPLSIKYGMNMLIEGADGETKEQITNQFNTPKLNRYLNNVNMSIANAFFVRDTFSKNIKSSYLKTLKNEYNASVIYDSFTSPDTINKWVSDKTFKLINNLVDDSITEKDFALINTVAIDMEWVNKIQAVDNEYYVSYQHRRFWHYIEGLELSGFHPLEFSGISEPVESVELGAVINKYDIVNTLGADKIRNEVSKAYQNWLNEGAPFSCEEDISKEPSVTDYVNTYMEEINKGYKDISSSTDFTFYVDDNITAFAKDLKQYGNTTLQYVAIMPKKAPLKSYISNLKSSDITSIINKLKEVKLENFDEGYITSIEGYIPMFQYDYELNLISDLHKLGIKNIFYISKADLSKMANTKVAIDEAKHKANISFSNDGIKAAAAFELGGAGAGDCGFDYFYDVPIKKIDLSFNKPYIYLIREKSTGEIWFVGSVYEPTTYTEVEYNGKS